MIKLHDMVTQFRVYFLPRPNPFNPVKFVDDHECRIARQLSTNIGNEQQSTVYFSIRSWGREMSRVANQLELDRTIQEDNGAP